MNLKYFELRDRHTFIPIFAFRARPRSHREGGGAANDPPDFPSHQRYIAERYLLARAGYGPDGSSDCVVIGRLGCELPAHSECTHDPYAHNSPRTFTVAHEYLVKHFDELESGAVIDVEFILGETKEAKVSERVQYPET